MKGLLKICCLISFVILSTDCSEDQRYGGTYTADPGTDGTNSSYTSVVAVQDRMYYIDASKLYTADISDPTDIRVLAGEDIGLRLETLFSINGLLFVGSGPAMHIFALEPADGLPVRLSETSYANFDVDFFPCDPVVADDQFAYVTLSTFEGGGWGFPALFFFPFPICQRPQPVNELRIYDISSLTAPIRVSTTDLSNPKGLAIDGDILYVCDLSTGVHVYDVKDRSQPVLIDMMTDQTAFDVVAKDDLLYVTGPNSIAQYDISDPSNISLISIYDFQ